MLHDDRSTAPAQPRVRVARGTPGPLVLTGGFATTALALAGVWALSRTGENVMGWYGSYVIPAGALLVGVVASSGFGLASWATGAKITGRLLAGRRAANRLSSRIHVRLVHCRRCEAGELRASLLTGQGKQLETAPLETLALEKATVSEVLRARAAGR